MFNINPTKELTFPTAHDKWVEICYCDANLFNALDKMEFEDGEDDNFICSIDWITVQNADDICPLVNISHDGQYFLYGTLDDLSVYRYDGSNFCDVQEYLTVFVNTANAEVLQE